MDKWTKSSISCRNRGTETWVQVLTLTPTGREFGQVSQAGQGPTSSSGGVVHTTAAQVTQEYAPEAECPALLRAPDPHASALSTFSASLRASCYTCFLPVVQQRPVTSHVPPSFSFPNSCKQGPSFSPSTSFAGVLSTVLCCHHVLCLPPRPILDPKHTQL